MVGLDQRQTAAYFPRHLDAGFAQRRFHHNAGLIEHGAKVRDHRFTVGSHAQPEEAIFSKPRMRVPSTWYCGFRATSSIASRPHGPRLPPKPGCGFRARWRR